MHLNVTEHKKDRIFEVNEMIFSSGGWYPENRGDFLEKEERAREHFWVLTATSVNEV